ncbi:MAG: 4Fe-4S ferredoxin [Sphaerochaetaceae bacterium]|jgi:NAD-dependent dihydropyrimidine dehydrogenase PreA subunit
MHVARNLALCTKDCLCLFVCPTGATDTETGQIDFAKCLDGCRLCVDACPSNALYIVYDSYPVKPKKHDDVLSALDALLESKVMQESIADSLKEKSLIAKAIALSNRILAEDCARESRYMLPQGEGTKELLRSIKEETPTIVEKLLETL